MQNTCKCCATHPRQQSTNVDGLGRGGDKREGQFWGIEPQKGVMVELIEWRLIDLHSINSKSTFCLLQSGKRTGTYSACILGVRLCYQRHGENALKVQSKDKSIQYCHYLKKGGFPM
jgi:hypothetical protein